MPGDAGSSTEPTCAAANVLMRPESHARFREIASALDDARCARVQPQPQRWQPRRDDHEH
jgi:hypothetical protein